MTRSYLVLIGLCAVVCAENILNAESKQPSPVPISVPGDNAKNQAVHRIASSLEMRCGVPVLLINNQPVVPMMMWGISTESMKKTAAVARANGIRLFTTCVNLPWPRTGEAYDYSAIDAEMASLLQNIPDAMYMPRVWIGPPDWWKKENPNEMPVWENRQIENDNVSVTSEKWLTEACKHIDVLVRYMESRWGDHIFAYHPSAMNSGEWYYTSTIWSPPDWGLRHYEPGFKIAYQQWLIKRYSDIAQLNRVWQSDYKAFDEIDVPAAADRKATRHGLLRNPVAERRIIDFTIYQSVAVTDAIARVSKAFRSATDGKKLIYTFYGYTFELAGLQEGIANFGHLNFEAAMDDRDVDVWCAPTGYYDRRNGGSGPIMAPAESVNARSQVWCNEDDLRTHLTPKDTSWGRVDTLDETLWCHRRNFMASFVHRSQMWFMEQGPGWLNDEAIWQNIGAMQNLYKDFYANPSPLKSDVAVVVDEKSMMQIAYGIEIGLPLLYDLRAQINRIGTTPEIWLLDDYLKGRVTDKKLVIFLNAFSLTDPQRQIVKTQLKADHAIALWFYAPGILTPDAHDQQNAFSVQGVESLTGIKVAIRPGEHSPAMRLIPTHPFAANVPADTRIEPDDVIKNWQSRDEAFQFRQMTFPPRKKLYPLLAVTDPAAEPFGHYGDVPEIAGNPGLKRDGDTDVAMAVKQADGFRSVFVGGLTLPAGVFANIASSAGVHLYCPAGDVVYTDGRYLSLTACSPGEKTLTLPRPAEVIDIFTNEKITVGKVVTVTLKLGETRIYRLAPVIP